MNRKILLIFIFKAKKEKKRKIVTLICILNNHVDYDSFIKTQIFASYDVICVAYITMFTLTLKFQNNYLSYNTQQQLQSMFKK